MKRSLFLLLILALALGVTACSQSGGAGSASQQAAPAAKPEPASAEKPEEPKYTSWVAYINDDDSYSAGGITYKIALNVTATNPTGDEAGKYTGKATASTSTEGNVGGAPLSAQAIANSGTLQFALDDPTGGGQLTPLTNDELVYKGTGTITMNAAGTASVGPASGGFSNSSGQNIQLQAQGSKVTLSVVVSGHKYTFDGTISGK